MGPELVEREERFFTERRDASAVAAAAATRETEKAADVNETAGGKDLRDTLTTVTEYTG